MEIQREGFVAILDMLGARGMWANRDHSDIYRSWSRIQEMVTGQAKLNTSLGQKFIDKEFKMNSYSFSDTIIVTVSSQNYDIGHLPTLAGVLGRTFMTALNEGILFRGAIAGGKYHKEENMILGPAIDDAADWYSKTDWAGIHLTPSTAIKFDGFRIEVEQHDKYSKLLETLIPYEIPYKNGMKRDGWAVCWPHSYFKMEGYAINQKYMRKFRQHARDILSTNPIGEKELPKYLNTIEFLEHVLVAIDPKRR